MKTTFDSNNSEITFKISNFDEKYISVFEQCFWQKDGDSYIKSFPANYKHIGKVKKNFEKNSKGMFDQLGYFTEVMWEKALDDFANIMEKSNIDWWLTGSCAACIRGVKLNPHDVDIMVDSRDVEKIANLFSDNLIIPIVDTNGWVTKDFGVIFMHARIDIASDPVPELDDPEPIDCGPYARDHLETINWRNHKIKVPPIELTLAVNKKRGRHDRVKLIEEYMRKN